MDNGYNNSEFDPVRTSKSIFQTISFIDLLDSDEPKQIKRRFAQFWIWIRNHFTQFIFLLSIVVIILGFIGYSVFYEHQYINQPERKFAIILYSIFKLFIGFLSVDKVIDITGEDGNIWLVWAIGLAPFVTGYAGMVALFTIFHEKATLLRIRFIRNHIVIVGLGEKGIQLVRDHTNQGDKVVVIDIDFNNKNLKPANLLGAIIIVGDGTDIDVLKKAKVHSASHIIVVSGYDKINLKITTQIYQIVTENRGVKHSKSQGGGNLSKIKRSITWFISLIIYKNDVNCKVHLINQGFLGLISNHKIFTDTKDYFELSFFNSNINASRILFFDNPIDSLGDTRSIDAPPIHLLIHGINDTGTSVALQAIKLGHFANGKRMRITFIGENHKEKERRFLAHYPQFNEIADFKFFGDNSGIKFSRNVVTIDENYNFPLSAIIICSETEEMTLADSLMYSRLIDTKINPSSLPIFVHLKDNLGLSTTYDVDTRVPDNQSVITFGNTNRVSTSELVIQGKLDILAKTIHDTWLKNNDGPEWHDLPDYLQDSNRQQADHILVKLRTINTKVSKVKRKNSNSKQFEFTSEEIDLLSRMEHRRWVAERFLNGWKYGEEQDRNKKISPYLITYDELPDNIKQTDREAVLIIPKLLGLLNFEIIRN